eukprot:8115488-Pyramimonas_sp.AAC.1
MREKGEVLDPRGEDKHPPSLLDPAAGRWRLADNSSTRANWAHPRAQCHPSPGLQWDAKGHTNTA